MMKQEKRMTGSEAWSIVAPITNAENVGEFLKMDLWLMMAARPLMKKNRQVNRNEGSMRNNKAYTTV